MHPIPETKANRRRRVGIILSLVPWFLWFVRLTVGEGEWTQYFDTICIVSRLTFSPVALVLFISVFRHIPGSGWKGLYILLSGVPFLQGLCAIALWLFVWFFPVRM